MSSERIFCRRLLVGLVLTSVAAGTMASAGVLMNAGPVYAAGAQPVTAKRMGQPATKGEYHVLLSGMGEVSEMHSSVAQTDSRLLGGSVSPVTRQTPEPGEDRPFSGALFATLVALIGVVTVARRGMPK